MSRRLLFAFCLFYLGFHLIVSSALIKTKKKFVFLGFNVTTSPTPKYESYFNKISLAPIPPGGSPYLNVNFTVAESPATSDGFIRSSILIRQLSTETYSSLIVGKRHNLCALLNKPKLDIYLHKVILNLNQNTPFLKQCPLVVGDYEIRNFAPDIETVPSFMPISTYLIKLEMFHLIEKRYYNVATTYLGAELKSLD